MAAILDDVRVPQQHHVEGIRLRVCPRVKGQLVADVNAKLSRYIL